MSYRPLLPVAALAAAVLALPGCVFSIGGGHGHAKPGPAEPVHLGPVDREQIALAEAYAAQSFTRDQRDGLVKLAERPDLTPAARLRIVELARGLSFTGDRQAVLDALADRPPADADAPRRPAPPAAPAL